MLDCGFINFYTSKVLFLNCRSRVIKRILNANVDWKLFYEFFKSVMKEYKDVVNLSFNGFPRNWEQVLDKELNHCASPLKKI